MARRMLKYTGSFTAFCLALVLTQAGCVKVLTTVAYFVKGTNDPPEYTGLKDKRVAVVCRPQTELRFGMVSAPNDLATRVGMLLKQNGKRVKIVSQSKVSKWIDENPEMELQEIGRGVDADVVLGIDVLEFNLLQGQTLYQGKSQVKLTVCNVEDGEVLWEKPMRQIVWPARGGEPADKPLPQFQREYIEVLATEIGNLFYAHEHFSRQTELIPD